MINLTIRGKIKHFFEVRHFDSDEFMPPNATFLKQQIVITTEDCEDLTITFRDQKTQLLEFCKYGSIIESSIFLEGRMWRHNNKFYSTNELNCRSLKIISNSEVDPEISYKDEPYYLQRYFIDDSLQLKLVHRNSANEIVLTHVHFYPNKALNNTHVLIKESFSKELIGQMEKKGILTNPSYIKTKEGYTGYTCRLLVLHLFKADDTLHKN